MADFSLILTFLSQYIDEGQKIPHSRGALDGSECNDKLYCVLRHNHSPRRYSFVASG